MTISCVSSDQVQPSVALQVTRSQRSIPTPKVEDLTSSDHRFRAEPVIGITCCSGAKAIHWTQEKGLHFVDVIIDNSKTTDFDKLVRELTSFVAEDVEQQMKLLSEGKLDDDVIIADNPTGTGYQIYLLDNERSCVRARHIDTVIICADSPFPCGKNYNGAMLSVQGYINETKRHFEDYPVVA